MNEERAKWTDDEIKSVEDAERWATDLDNDGLVSEFTQAVIMWTHHRKTGNRVQRDLWVKIADVHHDEILLRLKDDE